MRFIYQIQAFGYIQPVPLTGLQLGLPLAEPATWTAGAAAWLTVYAGAIGVHSTTTKAVVVATGTTNRAGPDAA